MPPDSTQPTFREHMLRLNSGKVSCLPVHIAASPAIFFFVCTRLGLAQDRYRRLVEREGRAQYSNMAPKSAQDKVRHLRREGRTEAEIRARRKEEGYKPGRITQLLTRTRAEEVPQAETVFTRLASAKFCRRMFRS